VRRRNIVFAELAGKPHSMKMTLRFKEELHG
jgi:hypothetical protein